MAGMNPPLILPIGRSSDFIMHIYACDQWIVRGRASHVQSGRSILFHSLMELILAVQAKMDEIAFPQSATAPRKWKIRQNQPPMHCPAFIATEESSDDILPESIMASFLIRVQFRQNSSWQGTLVWMEHKESCAFRSLLELLNLLADALQIVVTASNPAGVNKDSEVTTAKMAAKLVEKS